MDPAKRPQQSELEALLGDVLSRLASIEAGPAIEQGVLDRLASVPAPHASLQLRWNPALATAACLVATLAAALSLKLLPYASRTNLQSTTTHTPASSPPRHIFNTHTPASPGPSSSSRRALSMQRSLRPESEQALAPKGETSVPARPAPHDPEAALALSEMLAPSKPAPPEPLTAQEKLLARAAHARGASSLIEDDDAGDDVTAAAQLTQDQTEANDFLNAVQASLFAGMPKTAGE